MKPILAICALFLGMNCFANDIIRTGTITKSIYDKAIGKECSISLEKIVAQGASTIAYYAKIKMKVPTRYVKKLKINDLTAKYDAATEHMSNVLAGMGSLHRMEISQRLFVFFDDKGSVQKYAYRDGTRSMFGEFSYECELH